MWKSFQIISSIYSWLLLCEREEELLYTISWKFQGGVGLCSEAANPSESPAQTPLHLIGGTQTKLPMPESISCHITNTLDPQIRRWGNRVDLTRKHIFGEQPAPIPKQKCNQDYSTEENAIHFTKPKLKWIVYHLDKVMLNTLSLQVQ